MLIYLVNMCECWCGGEASKDKMFIRSHNSRVVSEETRRKRSESLKGQKRTEEQCKHISESCKNKPPMSDETRQKMSVSLKGKPAWNAGLKMSEEYCQKLKSIHPDQSGENNPMYGKHHTDEVRQQISESMKGKQKTPEHQAKITAANTGKKRTEEQIEQMRKITTEYFSHPENRIKASHIIKDKWENDEEYRERILTSISNRSEETNRKISISVKKLWEEDDNLQKELLDNESYRERQKRKHKEYWDDSNKRIEESARKIQHYQDHPETCAKISISRKGKCVGEDNPAWKGGVTSKNKLIRASNEYKQWVKQVFERDQYKCHRCNNGGKLIAHHIINFAKLVREESELLFDISNGITFCRDCHKQFHKRYTMKNNNTQQIFEFVYLQEK